MNPHSDKNIAQLRHHASTLGITGASRKRKDDLLALIAEKEQARQAGRSAVKVAPDTSGMQAANFIEKHFPSDTPDGLRSAGTMYGQPVTRAQRDALQRRTEVVFDPGANLTDRDRRSRAALPRFERRHVVHTARTVNGVQTSVTNIPRGLRRAGAMESFVSPATLAARALAKAIEKAHRDAGLAVTR